MGHAPGVHQLDEKMAACGMYRSGGLFPSADVGIGVDTGSGEIALAISRGLSALGNDESDTGALRIVFGGQRTWRAIELCAASGHGGHGQTVG